MVTSKAEYLNRAVEKLFGGKPDFGNLVHGKNLRG